MPENTENKQTPGAGAVTEDGENKKGTTAGGPSEREKLVRSGLVLARDCVVVGNLAFWSFWTLTGRRISWMRESSIVSGMAVSSVSIAGLNYLASQPRIIDSRVAGVCLLWLPSLVNLQYDFHTLFYEDPYKEAEKQESLENAQSGKEEEIPDPDWYKEMGSQKLTIVPGGSTESSADDMSGINSNEVWWLTELSESQAAERQAKREKIWADFEVRRQWSISRMAATLAAPLALCTLVSLNFGGVSAASTVSPSSSVSSDSDSDRSGGWLWTLYLSLASHMIEMDVQEKRIKGRVSRGKNDSITLATQHIRDIVRAMGVGMVTYSVLKLGANKYRMKYSPRFGSDGSGAVESSLVFTPKVPQNQAGETNEDHKVDNQERDTDVEMEVSQDFDEQYQSFDLSQVSMTLVLNFAIHCSFLSLESRRRIKPLGFRQTLKVYKLGSVFGILIGTALGMGNPTKSSFSSSLKSSASKSDDSLNQIDGVFEHLTELIDRFESSLFSTLM